MSNNIKMPKIPKMPDFKFHDMNLSRHMKKIKIKDMSVAAAFVGAIAVLLMVACYVIARLESDRAYRARWRDYNDCGWA